MESRYILQLGCSLEPLHGVQSHALQFYLDEIPKPGKYTVRTQPGRWQGPGPGKGES